MADAGTCTCTEYGKNGNLYRIDYDWVCDASGDATGGATFSTTLPYTGVLQRLITWPESSAAPTDDYDVYIYDEDGADVLMAAGKDRDETNKEQVLGTSLGVVFNSKLSIVVDNAGSAKEGHVILYIDRRE